MEKETIEEVLPKNNNGKYSRNEIEKSFESGAKWQAEQDKNKYSDEEVLDVLREFYKTFDPIKNPPQTSTIPLWFEQFKKK